MRIMKYIITESSCHKVFIIVQGKGGFVNFILNGQWINLPLESPESTIFREGEVVLQNIQIVLLEPEGSGNVGAVCRAMKAMGITRLGIVNSPNLSVLEIKTYALHAFDIWEEARHYKDLREALEDSVFTAGTTRRRGKFRKYFTLLPEELAVKIGEIREGTVSIVFGNEVHGLTDEQLAQCAVSVTIPTAPDFPSLNLSHAVQIITYELYRNSFPKPKYTPLKNREISDLTEDILNTLSQMGFFVLAGRDHMGRFLRDILTRAMLSKTEAKRLETLFTKIRHLSKKGS